MAENARTHENIVVVSVEKADGTKHVQEQPNLRTNAGVDWQAAHMFSSAVNVMNQIALTENTDAPASGNTNLASELAADGLSRKTATFAHTTSQSLLTLSASWQYTGGSVVTVAKASVCSDLTDNDASHDSHMFMTAVSPVVVLDSNDTIAIDWGISI